MVGLKSYNKTIRNSNDCCVIAKLFVITNYFYRTVSILTASE